MSVLIRNCLVFLCCLIWPAAALANCADFRTIERDALQGYDIATVQTGLRAALENDNVNLKDGLLGSVTRNALAQLCQRIPRAGSGADVAETLDLATDYGDLSKALPEWRSLVLDQPLVSRLATSNSQTGLALHLAAGPAVAAATLTDARQPQTCDALGSLGSVPEAAQTALDLLAGPERGYAIADICRTFPDTGTSENFLNAMTRLGEMDLQLPEAIDDLASDQFGAWLSLAPGDRLPRLLGSPPAVLALLQEYQVTKNTPSPIEDTPSAPPRPASCEVSPADSSTRFFAFSQSNLDALTEPVDLQAAFAAVEDLRFASAAQLWAALEAQLAPILDQCSLDQIEALVLEPETLGLAFLIDEEGTKSLSFQDALQDVMPVVEPFIGRIAPDEERLISGLTAAVSEAVTTSVQAEVELAATTLAAAAEPVQPLFDTLPEGVPEFERPPLPETIGVTDATDLALANTIVNEAFRDALERSNYLPATQPEILKGDVRRILRPVAQAQIDTAVAAKMAQIEPVIQSTWMLTPWLRARILAVPDIGVTLSDPSGVDLATRMRSLVGLEYPNAGLFRAALDTVPPAPGTKPGDPALSPQLIEAAKTLAQREVADVFRDRSYGPLAAPDCGCVPVRPPTAEVYGFYPFWFAPLADPPAPAEGAEAPAQTLELVDFSLISRIAFYGMEMAFANPEGDEDTRNLRLLHEDRWIEARRDFVNSAHRHRARVDVAIDLRGWSDWTAQEIDTATTEMARQLRAFERVPTRSFADIRAALPTFFDPTSPDGITLIFESYPGKTLSQLNVQNVVDIVKGVHAKLPQPERQLINVAVDFDMVDEPGAQPVLSDLSDLLLTGRTLDQRRAEGIEEGQLSLREQRETEIVHKILIFLERPTTETKKSLRARMDRSTFRGKERSEILRSIIPVLPPGGHEFEFQRQQANETRDEETLRFSQFIDDVIYFEDNFSGIGFWPLPRLGGSEFSAIREAIALDWNQPRLPAHLGGLEASIGDVCTWACPNRAYVTFAAAALFALVLLLTARSFYSGAIHQLAFRFGAVWIGMGAVIVMLFVLNVCDHEAIWPGILMLWLVAILALIIGYNFVQRIKNGPKP
ncbi:hypothetical protein So717_24500 [Roseobacter cerasinus]|uniref:Peptidoglycan binding-like domain-containing protein n=1 Tax=Roseobacter cerasinus TaxID=2602289 RepID=A0A640VSB4_9RHOB|nr:hypothetical protein [Roseobacter cerasinus]GFE50697.1 hypothetical protein So717_24500 [Roseobacter cerasinus]